MSSAKEFREYAQECKDLARTALSEQERKNIPRNGPNLACGRD